MIPMLANPARAALALAVLALIPLSPAGAQGLEYVTAHYTKHEYKIPMRDGVKLFTSVYVPKDAKHAPMMLMRTPYSVAPYGIDQYRENVGPSPHFGRAGYIVAYQDVRGRYLSEGQFVDVRPTKPEKKSPADIDESSDTFDTIDWLVKNIPGNNGRVGSWGISYPGFYAAATAVESHPALKAASPQAPLVDWFLGDDVHHNGAFFLHQSFDFDAVFGVARPEPTSKVPARMGFDHGTPDAYDFFLRLGPLSNANKLHFKGERAFWNEEMDHPNYDTFWQERALWPHLKNTKPAVMTVGGWYDAEDLFGPLKTYHSIEDHNPNSQNLLVMGPWVHGGWSRGDGQNLGSVKFASKTGEHFREHIEFAFFEHYLRTATPGHPSESSFNEKIKAWAFETGRNEWHGYESWPPAEAKSKTLYIGAGGKLAFEPPSKSDDESFDEYPSDPAHPVPYTSLITPRYPATFMVEDQRFASRRPDVLTYATDPLTEDVRMVGPIKVDLQVSTTGTDSDWVVKVIDVYPNEYPEATANPQGPPPPPNAAAVPLGGFQQLVRGDVMRGRFRKSFETPEPFKPGEPTLVPIVLPDSHHTFRAGHKIMVQIQSSWFPLVDRNPQTFVDIYKAKESDFKKATQRVYRTPERPTKLQLLVLP